WDLVQEGEVTFTIQGRPPRVLRGGDAVYVPRGTIHRNQNLSSRPARSIEILVMDTGKPQTEVVSE
ncbi:MAG: cupin domain-containing protein, partial [Polyangiaceae bacterium]